MIGLPCKCAIDLSMHITDHSKTLIDHIYVNVSIHFYISGVALSNLSDHFDNFVIMIAKATKSNKTKRYQIRDMSKFDHEKFLQNFANDLNTNFPNNNESVHNKFEKIYETFSNNVIPVLHLKTPLEEKNDYLQNPDFHKA